MAQTYLESAPAWHARAACAGRDPEVFFPENRKTLAQELHASWPALRICATCPVARECITAALEQMDRAPYGVGLDFGVFGSTPLQREAVRHRPDRVEILLAELRRQTARGVA